MWPPFFFGAIPTYGVLPYAMIPSMVKSREHRNHCRVWLHYCYTVCCFFVYADIQWSAQGGKCWWSQHRGLSLCNKQIPWLFHVRKLQCSLSHTHIYYVYSTIRNDHRSCCFSICIEWTDLHSCYVWSWSSHAVKFICSWLSAEHLASEYKELKGVRVITLFHQFSIFLPGYTNLIDCTCMSYSKSVDIYILFSDVVYSCILNFISMNNHYHGNRFCFPSYWSMWRRPWKLIS